MCMNDDRSSEEELESKLDLLLLLLSLFLMLLLLPLLLLSLITSAAKIAFAHRFRPRPFGRLFYLMRASASARLNELQVASNGKQICALFNNLCNCSRVLLFGREYRYAPLTLNRRYVQHSNIAKLVLLFELDVPV